MTQLTRLCCATALVAAFLPQTLLAEVSPRDVWQNQKEYLETFGGEMTNSVSYTGTTMQVSDTTLTYQFPFDFGSLTLKLPGFSLLENGDGTVAVQYPEMLRYGIAAEIAGQGSFSADLDFTLQEYSLIASGDPRDVTYAWSFDRMDIRLGNVQVNLDKPAKGKLGQFELTGRGSLVDFSGTSRITVGTLVETTSAYDTGRQEFLVTGGFDNIRFNYVGGAESVSSQSGASLPRGGMDILNLAAALRDGLALKIKTTTNGYHTSQIVEESGAVVSEQSTRTGTQSVDFVLDRDSLRMSGTAQDTEIDAPSSKDLPFPVNFSLDNARFGATLPLLSSLELQDFAYLVSLQGLEMTDGIWDMFDPAATLSRDPVDMTIDVSGKVLNRLDWLDFLTVKQKLDSGFKPLEIHALNLNELLLEMAGASLTGSGAASFDNSDQESLGGFPKPTGAVDLVLKGGNGLLDNLVAMGLMSDQDAMGARMAVAVFTSPDPEAGEDVLKSRLEMNEQGHILANGQRIQ